MTPLDTELFNEFKRLDKLLRESRGTERGVSDYIDEMKAVPRYESTRIPGWERDLDRLWYCRHLRNKLAHDAVSEEYPLCDPENVAFLKSFHARVLNGEDPLTNLRKYRLQLRQANQARGSSTNIYRAPTPSYTAPRPRESQPQGCLACLIGLPLSAALLWGLLALIQQLIR